MHPGLILCDDGIQSLCTSPVCLADSGLSESLLPVTKGYRGAMEQADSLVLVQAECQVASPFPESSGFNLYLQVHYLSIYQNTWRLCSGSRYKAGHDKPE